MLESMDAKLENVLTRFLLNVLIAKRLSQIIANLTRENLVEREAEW